MSTHYWTTGDNLPPVKGTCKLNNAVYDLSGATIRFLLRKKGTTAVLVNKAAQIDGDPTLGKVIFTPAATGDVPTTAGDYEAEFEVRKGSDILTFPNASKIPIKVTKEIGSPP